MSQGAITSGGMGGCRELSINTLIRKDEKRNRHKARNLLSRASRAARAGKLDRSLGLHRQAVGLIGADEVHVICEEQRLGFIQLPIFAVDPPAIRHGFVR